MGGDGSSMGGDARGAEGGGLSISGNGACACRTPGRPVEGPSGRLTVLGLAAVGVLLRRRRR